MRQIIIPIIDEAGKIITTQIFTNPNPEGGIAETKTLNRLSKALRESDVDIKEEGFIPCQFDFVWEYEVCFDKGHIVFRETAENTLKVWAYKSYKDLEPLIVEIRNTNLDLDGKMFIRTVRELKRMLEIKNLPVRTGGSSTTAKKKKRK